MKPGASRGYVKVKSTQLSIVPRKRRKFAKVRAAAIAGRRANVKRMRMNRSKKGR